MTNSSTYSSTFFLSMTPSELFLLYEYSNSERVMSFPAIFIMTGSSVCAVAVVQHSRKAAMRDFAFILLSFGIVPFALGCLPSLCPWCGAAASMAVLGAVSYRSARRLMLLGAWCVSPPGLLCRYGQLDRKSRHCPFRGYGLQSVKLSMSLLFVAAVVRRLRCYGDVMRV